MYCIVHVQSAPIDSLSLVELCRSRSQGIAHACGVLHVAHVHARMSRVCTACMGKACFTWEWALRGDDVNVKDVDREGFHIG